MTEQEQMDLLSADEYRAYKTPFCKMTKQDSALAFSAKEKIVDYIHKKNKEHGPLKIGSLSIVKDKWDAYQSPIDGKVISTPFQRDRDLKENNCVDARELTKPGTEYFSGSQTQN